MAEFARLVWDQIGEKLYETGVDRGVVYPQANGAYPAGVAWNGLTAVNLTPSGAEPTKLYANNGQYATLMSAEEVALTIEAYTYPDEFAACDGSASVEGATGVRIGQQTRQPFGFCYRTLIGNDTEGTEHGYKLHLVYGCLAAPSEQAAATVNDSPEARTMSWEVSTTPVPVTGFKPTAHIEIDSTAIAAEKLTALENVLYGTDSAAAYLPLPDAVIALIKGEDA